MFFNATTLEQQLDWHTQGDNCEAVILVAVKCCTLKQDKDVVQSFHDVKCFMS